MLFFHYFPPHTHSPPPPCIASLAVHYSLSSPLFLPPLIYPPHCFDASLPPPHVVPYPSPHPSLPSTISSPLLFPFITSFLWFLSSTDSFHCFSLSFLQQVLSLLPSLHRLYHHFLPPGFIACCLKGSPQHSLCTVITHTLLPHRFSGAASHYPKHKRCAPQERNYFLYQY